MENVILYPLVTRKIAYFCVCIDVMGQMGNSKFLTTMVLVSNCRLLLPDVTNVCTVYDRIRKEGRGSGIWCEGCSEGNLRLTKKRR